MTPNKRLFQITTYRFTGAVIINKDNIIEASAPVLKRFVGKHITVLYQIYRGAQIKEVAWEEEGLKTIVKEDI